MEIITDKSIYLPGEIIWFKIRPNYDMSTDEHARPRILYVELLDQQGTPSRQAKIDLHDLSPEGSFYIPVELENGSYQLVGYIQPMQEVMNDYLFQKQIQVVNPYSNNYRFLKNQLKEAQGISPKPSNILDIQSSFDQTKVAKRHKIALDVISYFNGQRVGADLSISVHAINKLQQMPSSSTHNPTQSEIKDNLSVYERIFDKVQVSYLHKGSNRPITGQEVFLTIIGQYPKLYVSTTDSQGIATFFVQPFYGLVDMATQVADGTLSDVSVLSPFATKHNLSSIGTNTTGFHTDNLSDQFDDETLNTYLVNVQLENLFYNTERSVFKDSPKNTIPFYGIADKTYLLDDYTRFVLMEEVLREYVSEVSLRRSSGNYYFRVLDHIRNLYQSGQPLITIDGIPFRDVNDIIAYDPLKIERIDITTSKFVFGKTIYEGLVNFYTYKGDIEGFALPEGVTIFNYEGLQKKRVFFQPEYETEEQKNSRMPDRRNVLMWRASLDLDESKTASVQFTTSDIPGEYAIVVEGMDKEGNKGRMVKYFTVE